MFLVSVIVPVYNVEPYIERCARSLFSQTYPELEYIFVDDCSPDNSIAVLKKTMADYPSRTSSIRIIRHEKNRGLAAVRNTGLINSTGLYVCHVDSDDWLEPNAIELLVKKQEETNADIVSGSALMYTYDGTTLLEEPDYPDRTAMVLQQLEYTLDHVLWKRIIRRSLFLENGIMCLEGCDMSEDRYLMTQLSYYAHSYARIDDHIYNYERRNPNSMMIQEGKEKRLRCNTQYLDNWIGLCHFFSDKDEVFFNVAAEKTVLFAEFLRNLALKYGDKTVFRKGTDTINQLGSRFWHLIGWQSDGIKGYLLQSYPYMRVVYFRKRINRFIKGQ